jgi:hypothetical protein
MGKQRVPRSLLTMWRKWGILIAVTALAGCGGASVTVPALFPVPVVERLPLTMGVHLDDALVNYVFTEDLGEGGEWEIELGRAQEQMFTNLLSGMFDGVYRVADPQQPDASVAGVLVPSITEVQFSTPLQTRTEYFEVWVRYQFRLYDRDGRLVTEWPLTAYGKANEDNYGLQSRAPALPAAAVEACRDAMAFFTVQFRSIPDVQRWLLSEAGGPTS